MKNYKIILAFLLLCFTIHVVSAQQFQRTYGGASDDYGYSSQQLNNGGYIVCGRTISYGVGGYDNYLLRLNSLGDTLWIKTYGNIGKEIKMITFTGKQCTIEKGEMNPGIYFVNITDQNKNVTNKKMIIQ